MSEWKPEPVSSSALIPLNGLGGGHPAFRNFSSMQGVEDLNMLQNSAPGWHQATVNNLKAAGKVRGEDATQIDPRLVKVARRVMTFGTGARVRDLSGDRPRKGIIIHAKAGYTKKKNIPVHKLADKNGNTWLAKESDLDLIL